METQEEFFLSISVCSLYAFKMGQLIKKKSLNGQQNISKPDNERQSREDTLELSVICEK